MPYDFLTGGARSGKSRAAERRASTSGSEVTFVATAEPGDEEMATRIARHRADRPADWETVEEPIQLVRAIRAVDPERFIVVDCLTLWLANVLESDDDAILEHTSELTHILAGRHGGAAVVSNEVGDGIVPADPLTRRYRDLLGTVNRVMADRADHAYLIVAGRVLRLEPAPW